MAAGLCSADDEWITMNETNEKIEPVQIAMLGDFSITIGENKIDENNVHSKKSWKLLQYLIIFRNREISQSELIELLWPNGQSIQPASALKVVLYRLRKMLELLKVSYTKKLVVQKHGFCHWNNNYICEVDFEKFDEYCKKADSEKDDEVAIVYFRKAFELYKGKFLANVEMEQWLIPLQTYYHNVYLKALDRVFLIFAEIGEFNEIITLCQNALKLDIFEESIHYALLWAMVKIGNHNQVIDYYNYIEDLFYSQLGVRLSPKFGALLNEIDALEKKVETDLDRITADLKEEQKTQGPLYCEYEIFKKIFQLEHKLLSTKDKILFLGLVSIVSQSQYQLNNKMLNKSMEELLRSLMYCLKKEDMISRYSVSQYILFFPVQSAENAVFKLERVQKFFLKHTSSFEININYRLKKLVIK